MALNPRQLAIFRGHPTSPGPNDEQVIRRGGDSPGNGQPGVPRSRPTPESKGPGIPGHSPAGPMQPGIDYEGWDEA
jgi:hypothetical protein